MPMILRMQMLGTARFVIGDQQETPLKATIRDQALAYLAYTGEWVSRDRIGFLFWADSPDQVARHNVRQLLKRIRRLRWLTGLEVDGDAIRWLIPTDVDALRTLAVGGTMTDPPRSGMLLLGLERGSAYEFEEWLLLERSRILELWAGTLLKSADVLDHQGRPSQAAEIVELVLNEVDDGAALVRYMDLAMRAGHPDGAARMYQHAARRIRTNTGLEPPDAARDLYDRLQRGGQGEQETAPINLVGRTRETTEILGLLAQPHCRLLTLLGPGGIGKSTLADLVAKSAAPRYAGGVVVVSLESLSEPQSIPFVIAEELALELDGRMDVLDQLVTALRGDRRLLVVDNAEHLPRGSVWFSDLIRRCHGLQILVTSRERLRLEDEWVYEVTGLVPAEGAQLLIQRARQVAPGVAIEETVAHSISEVVGGSPLGIELAAPWLRVMSPEEIIEQLPTEPSLLSGGSRDKAERHRSLEAAMAHSWRLLSDEERASVEALSVFVAPYTLELARNAVDVNAIALRDLVDKSLVGMRSNGRYASHPLVRQYASSRLAADSARRSEVLRGHCMATLSLIEDPNQAISNRRHLDDIVNGWLHALEIGDAVLIGRSADGLAILLDTMGQVDRGLVLLDRAVAKIDDGSIGSLSVVAALKQQKSVLLQHTGRHIDSLETARAAVEAASGTKDHERRVRALISLAWAQKWIEGDDAQHGTLLEALPLAKSLDDDLLIAEVQRGLGCSAPTLEECREYLEQASERLSDTGSSMTRLAVLSSLGSVLWGLGEVQEAMRLHRNLLDIGRAERLDRMVILALIDLAFLHGEIGDLDTAAEMAAEAEARMAGAEFVDVRISAAQVAGEISRLRGDHAAAIARIHEGLQLATDIGMPSFGLRSLRLHGQLLVDNGEIAEGLGMLGFVSTWTRHGPDFTAWILDPRAWDESSEGVRPDVIEKAREWAGNQELVDVVANALAQTGMSLVSSGAAPPS